MKKSILLIIMTMLGLAVNAQSDFVKVVDGHFGKDGKP